ncbi:hypothetical protein L1987_02451 [Smallanthus sonchifolius]|uniref:Uncharacterized protein n=1 Tax=Smallanthus sonchifolius TaxID=185202 RepID=A0ACB9K7V4_9ASTR|nr:hypothetical protein L1987_02451 [Smallanthus sonchifolius]
MCVFQPYVSLIFSEVFDKREREMVTLAIDLGRGPLEVVTHQGRDSLEPKRLGSFLVLSFRLAFRVAMVGNRRQVVFLSFCGTLGGYGVMAAVWFWIFTIKAL